MTLLQRKKHMSIAQRTLRGKKTLILAAMWLFQRRFVEVITLVTHIRKVLVSSSGNNINYPDQVFKGLC